MDYTFTWKMSQVKFKLTPTEIHMQYLVDEFDQLILVKLDG